MNWERWFLGPLRDADKGAEGGGDPVVEDKDKGTNKKENEDDLSDDEVKSARSLYKALKDPDTAQEIIESLAKRAGILDKKGEPEGTKAETKKELGKITKALIKKLGKDYEGFSNLVGPALDEAMAEMLQEKFGESESNSVQEKWESAVDKFTETHTTPQKVERKMKELIERNPPNLNRRGFKASEYLEDMWELAHRKIGLDLPDNISESKKGRSPIPEITEIDEPKELTLDQKIEYAMKGIRLRK